MPDKEELAPGRSSRYGLDRWEFLHLIVYGKHLSAITEHFQHTIAALGCVPGCCNAMFSRLPPDTHRILKHHDGENGTLRVHVPLKVPKTGTCLMRIGDQEVTWELGRAFALDATVDHEVFKNSEEDRIIIILDFMPPAPVWLRMMCQWLYPQVMGKIAQNVLQESYSRLLQQRA